jgi:hypothetical protein
MQTFAQTLETGAYEFVALSRTISEEDLGCCERTRYFDYMCYSPRKYWLLYNVLLVQRDTSGASFRRDRLPVHERIEIGKVHVDTFDGAKRILVLA